MRVIVPIVEGAGDAAAVPGLLERLLPTEECGRVRVDRPMDAKGRPNLRKQLGQLVELASRRPRAAAAIVLCDADEDCPRCVACDLSARLREAGARCPVALVVANRMFEAWIVASLETTRGSCGIPGDLEWEGDPEALHNPKNWLSEAMGPARGYKETMDQAALTRRLDPDLARQRSRSFRRLDAALDFLLEAVREGRTGDDPPLEELECEKKGTSRCPRRVG